MMGAQPNQERLPRGGATCTDPFRMRFFLALSSCSTDQDRGHKHVSEEVLKVHVYEEWCRGRNNVFCIATCTWARSSSPQACRHMGP